MRTYHPENDPSLHVEVPAELIADLEQPNHGEPAGNLRNAIAFGIAIPVITIIATFGLMLASREVGGPICDAGTSNWICSRTMEILIPAITVSIAGLGVVGAALMTFRTWSHGERWAPWLAVLWVLIPFFMAWGTWLGVIALVGQK